MLPFNQGEKLRSHGPDFWGSYQKVITINLLYNQKKKIDNSAILWYFRKDESNASSINQPSEKVIKSCEFLMLSFLHQIDLSRRDYEFQIWTYLRG